MKICGTERRPLRCTTSARTSASGSTWTSAYEVLEAIEDGDARAVCEELGDVLLQIVFQSEIAAEAGHFTVADVARGIADKLVRRHPHVFGDVQVRDANEVIHNWKRIKAEE